MASKEPQIVICDKCGNHIPIKRRARSKRTYKNTKQGSRVDLGGMFFRSGWEANIARYLNYQIEHGKIEKWFYESKRFVFPTIKVGVRSYLPDFCIVLKDGKTEWIEVKGYMTKKGQTAINRFAKFYPKEKLTIVGKKTYEEIKKEYSNKIPEWED